MSTLGGGEERSEYARRGEKRKERFGGVEEKEVGTLGAGEARGGTSWGRGKVM